VYLASPAIAIAQIRDYSQSNKFQGALTNLSVHLLQLLVERKIFLIQNM